MQAEFQSEMLKGCSLGSLVYERATWMYVKDGRNGVLKCIHLS
jgi:hypothetical protein